jgi:peptidoglycan/xylan/chitin deacetylase (PgdA/CDA1 family)
MQYLKEKNYTPITPNKVEEKGDKLIMITFDDGYYSFYRHAFPILVEYNFTGIIFVITKYIGEKGMWDVSFGKRERHLNLQEIREIHKNNIIIGSHSRTHPDLTRVPTRKIKEEIENSKKELEDILGDRVDFFSYPFGRYNTQVVKIAMEAGYKLTFTSVPIVTDHNVIGRIGVFLIDGIREFENKLYKDKKEYFHEVRKSRIINFFSRGTWMWKKISPLEK